MKWIGQHIWSLISRFRSEVYFENLPVEDNTNFVTIDPDTGKLSQEAKSTYTQRGINDTPVDGATTVSISSNWAHDHNASTGNGAHVPAAGSSGQFLAHDGTWAEPSGYSLPEATSSTRGGIELFSDTDNSVVPNAVTNTASRSYGLQLNSAGQGVVNVPWTDTNTQLTLIDSDTMSGASASNVASAESVKAYVDAKQSYQYLTFSFKANSINADTWRSPSGNGPEYYLWNNDHTVGGTNPANHAPKDVAEDTTIDIDYLDQPSGFVIPKSCKLLGFYGNCRTNSTDPTSLRPVLGLFRAAEPSDGNTSDVTATVVAYDSYDTGSGNRKNRFLKLTASVDVDLDMGDLLFPAVGFDATANDGNGMIWGSFTILLKTTLP
jgi:hypothetical protein